MRKLVVVLICLATIVALFSVNNTNSTFSFEDYITKVSVSAEDRPSMPSTEKIEKVFLEFEENGSDSSPWYEIFEDIWTVCKLIYECVVYAVKILVYLVEMTLYLINIVSAMTYNLLVW